MMACTGQPISWLRLETYARDHADAAIGEHLTGCAACKSCLDAIERDVVALPALPAIAPRRRWRWPVFVVPALAAAAILVVVLRPRPHAETFAVKGVGEVTVGVVRERDGAITYDAREYRPGDRWKVIVTCPPAAGAFIDVSIGPDHPLAPAHLACGNRVVVPGAFTLTGPRGANHVCVHVAATEGGDGDQGCVTIRPE